MSSLAHLGRGWPYPVAVDPERHGLEYVAGPDKVRESIWVVLDTDPGERLMRPSFGCGLRRYLHEPNSVAVRALIKHDVERTLVAWEPRIKVTDVTVTPGEDPALVNIAIAYVHLLTGRPDNLVYPFSLA